jgi:hypothetical protein
VGIHCGITQVLQCINYIILEFTSLTIILHFCYPVPDIVTTGNILAFTYIYTFLHHVHLLLIFPTLLSLTVPILFPCAGPDSPFCSPILLKKKEKMKNRSFLLV